MHTVIKAPIAFAALFSMAIVYWTALIASWVLLPIVKLGFAFAAATRYIRYLGRRLGEWLEKDERRHVQPDIWCD